ncbi:hypothetical protein V8G54_002710 [Vigna mungo]|uniref:Uncharacterized protein n=1 Tax=Vigna mungo TaxID=3915 RepID=A0AAQ3SCW7_VIGMU
MDLADILREHLHLCCFSTALFVAAAICPHTLPKPLVRPFQNSLIFIAFPLVGVTKTWKESTLSKIVQLTEEAQSNKPKLQRWLDEFGERYSQVVVVLSIAIAVIGPLLFKWPFISTSGSGGNIDSSRG